MNVTISADELVTLVYDHGAETGAATYWSMSSIKTCDIVEDVSSVNPFPTEGASPEPPLYVAPNNNSTVEVGFVSPLDTAVVFD